MADHKHFLDALRDEAMPLQAMHMNILLRMALASSATHMLRSLALKVTTFIDDFTRRLLVDRCSIPIDTLDGSRAIKECYLRPAMGKGVRHPPRR